MKRAARIGTRATGAVSLSLLLGLSGAALAQAAPARGPSAACPNPGEVPGIDHDPLFTDSNVALFAGGDYTVDGSSAEAEGLLVVKGKATFAKSAGGVFNIGRVGAGSGILPPSGSVMLAVGGDLTVAKGTTVDVGHGLTAGPGYGGAVRVGGAIDEKGNLETNGGARSAGLGATAALTPYDTFDATLAHESSSLGALKTTGTAVRSGDTVTFRSTGTGQGSLQVFDIDATDLDGASSFVFQAIPEKSSVVVNVTGDHTVAVSPLSVAFNGKRADDYGSPVFGDVAARVLYNFEKTPSVTLGGGGNFMGSLLAPHASADLTASTNGRVYIGKDIHTHGTGNESHNYPWTGSTVFTCKPTLDQPVPPAPSTPASGTPSQPTPPATTPAAPSATPSQPERPGPTPSGSDSAHPAPTPSDAPPATTGGGGDGSLAHTGAQVAPYLIAAAVAAAIGTGLLILTRRRRRSS
ncbi:choice-of-anchor A family protein [Streptomyces sp. NPDC057197]|uniref:choice-of-anchor A family protein n=1 Tax=Streptomyces sp. NPDC057197 TaxID=3346045 RepID=UPI00362E9808